MMNTDKPTTKASAPETRKRQKQKLYEVFRQQAGKELQERINKELRIEQSYTQTALKHDGWLKGERTIPAEKPTHSHESGDHCPKCFNAGYDSGVISHKSQAAQLAEALRELHEQIRLGIAHGHITNLLWIEATVNAEEALAAYEATR